MTEEVGKELRANELKEDMMVVLFGGKEPNLGITARVEGVGKEMVVFHMAEISTALGLFVQGDGSLKDDAGRTITISEYLGTA